MVRQEQLALRIDIPSSQPIFQAVKLPSQLSQARQCWGKQPRVRQLLDFDPTFAATQECWNHFVLLLAARRPCTGCTKHRLGVRAMLKVGKKVTAWFLRSTKSQRCTTMDMASLPHSAGTPVPLGAMGTARRRDTGKLCALWSTPPPLLCHCNAVYSHLLHILPCQGQLRTVFMKQIHLLPHS